MDTAAEAEEKCRSLPHRDEMPQCWGRPSENAEDVALSSWPAGGTKSLNISRDSIETPPAGTWTEIGIASTKSGCAAVLQMWRIQVREEKECEVTK